MELIDISGLFTEEPPETETDQQAIEESSN